MNQFRKAPVAGYRHLPPLALAFFTVSLLAAGPVLARQCPRGQILRVSKNVCVDRSQGFRGHVTESHGSGQATGGHVFYGPTFHGPSKPSAESESEAQADDLQPASGAAEVERPLAKKPKSQPVSLAPSASPYGELSLESFPKP